MGAGGSALSPSGGKNTCDIPGTHLSNSIKYAISPDANAAVIDENQDINMKTLSSHMLSPSSTASLSSISSWIVSNIHTSKKSLSSTSMQTSSSSLVTATSRLSLINAIRLQPVRINYLDCPLYDRQPFTDFKFQKKLGE